MDQNQRREIVESFCTIVKMLAARGTPALQGIERFRDEDLATLSTGSNPVFHIDFPESSVRVVYDLHPKLKVNDVKRLVDPAGLSTVILVTRDKPQTLQLKGLEEASKSVEVFDIADLMHDLLKHELQPKSFEVLRDEAEIDAVLATWHCTGNRSKLPSILSNDPVAKYLGLKPGQVVKCVRVSQSAGESVYYRHCVRASHGSD